ncbi:MAG TPA: helix-turn-helix domain-containing protein [Geminicoccaceae bacterium]|nr:helix-turn-helix domain-containing protein [Geminicoccaceae bacterium]
MANNGAAAPDLLAAAFALIGDEGWRGFSFEKLARRTGVSRVELYRRFRSRGALLSALTRHADEAMLGVEEAELAGLPPRDRVFELLMRRLEALVPYRAGLKRLARDGRADPCVVLFTAARLERSFVWLQDAAGLRCHGLRASLARRALGLAYLRAMQVWFEDEGADLGKTMAELDKQLRRVQNIAGLREPRPRRADEDEAAQPA